MGLLTVRAYAGVAAEITSGSLATSSPSMAGCHDGWRRVGTLKDATLGKRWAVVASCEHPQWPARLEPESQWKPLPDWVPAGSPVVVISHVTGTAMRLRGMTVAPGRVGSFVRVRLINHALVRVRLTGRGQAEITGPRRWERR